MLWIIGNILSINHSILVEYGLSRSFTLPWLYCYYVKKSLFHKAKFKTSLYPKKKNLLPLTHNPISKICIMLYVKINRKQNLVNTIQSRALYIYRNWSSKCVGKHHEKLLKESRKPISIIVKDNQRIYEKH